MYIYILSFVWGSSVVKVFDRQGPGTQARDGEPHRSSRRREAEGRAKAMQALWQGGERTVKPLFHVPGKVLTGGALVENKLQSKRHAHLIVGE